MATFDQPGCLFKRSLDEPRNSDSVIVERALAKERQASVNHNDPGYLEKALEHLLSAEKLLASAGAKSP